MLYQVVGATLDLMETYSKIWKIIKGSDPVPTCGFQYAVGLEPIHVNVDRMMEKFRLGAKELCPLWDAFLPKDVLDFICVSQKLSKENFRMPDVIWAETIYSFALAYHKEVINREHLIKSLTPLYIERVASFVMETWESNAEEVEERIEQTCLSFENRKDFLLDKWV